MSVYWIVLGRGDRHQHGRADPAEGRGRGARFLAQLFDCRAPCSGWCLYGGAAMLYIVALRRIPMSVALPCTAVSYVAAALIGHYGFAEPMGAMQVGAIAMICAGVVVLALAVSRGLPPRPHGERAVHPAGCGERSVRLAARAKS